MEPVNYTELTAKQRKEVRLAYIDHQEGKCYHCKGSLSEKPPSEVFKRRVNILLFPNGFFTHPVHLHHNHETGMTIGAVHCYCNAVLWQFFGE